MGQTESQRGIDDAISKILSNLNTDDQQRLSEFIHESEQRFRNIIDASPMGIFIYRLEEDERLVFDGYNPAANRILGMDCQQFMGLTIEEAFPPLVQTEIPDRYRDAARDGTPWFTEDVYYDNEAQRITGAFEVHAFQTQSRVMAAMFLDITKRKETERQLTEARNTLEKKVAERTAELVKANEELTELTAQVVHSAKMAALGELTAGIAHELNQPLNGIKITSQSLQLDLKRNRFEMDKLDEKLGLINLQVNKMAEIIQHMRIFTRQTVGTSQREVGANDLIGNAFTFVEQQMCNHGIEVVKEFSDPPLFVKADAVGIEQVLLNLLSNARHALIKSEKPSKQLKVRVLAENQKVKVEIEDNGIGMTEAVQERIFDPFYTTKDPGEGTGLGLSISRKIVEEHQGELMFESQPGQWTRCSLILPQVFAAITEVPPVMEQ